MAADGYSGPASPIRGVHLQGGQELAYASTLGLASSLNPAEARRLGPGRWLTPNIFGFIFLSRVSICQKSFSRETSSTLIASP